MIERLSVAVLRTMVNAPPAMAELATSLITDGVAGRIVEWKRKEIAARQDIAMRVLRRAVDVQTHPQSPHVWVRLPEPWRTEAFVARARHRGILLTGAESFAVGHETDVQAIASRSGRRRRARRSRKDSPSSCAWSTACRRPTSWWSELSLGSGSQFSSEFGTGTRTTQNQNPCDPPRLDDRERRSALSPSADRAAVSRADRSPPASRSRDRPALHAAEHQDGRLSRKTARTARRARTTTRASSAKSLMKPRRGAGGGARGARERVDALLHGRGVARSARRRGVRCRADDGRGCGGAGHGGLHDARHADRRAGAAAEVGRADRVQPQSRHVAGVLSADHHHAHLSGSARHAAARAGRRAQRLLRRHRRHGRVVARSLRDARAARPPRPASRRACR